MWPFINKVWDLFAASFTPVAMLCLLVAAIFVVLFIWAEYKNYKYSNFLLEYQKEFTALTNLLDKAIDAVRRLNGGK